jgi:hypothetical protein
MRYITLAKALSKLELELKALDDKLIAARQKVSQKKAELDQAKVAKTQKALSKLNSERIDFLIELAGVDEEKMKTIKELIAD